MSVLIKGMEMPTDCIVCPFGWNGCNNQHNFVYMGSRPDNCPLVEVPTPHGRLIDSNELIKNIHNDWDDVLVWDESGAATADEFERLVYGQPNIIEAEEGAKNERPY